MALSPTLVDREQGKFRDAGGVTVSRVAVKIEDLAASAAVGTGAFTRVSVGTTSVTILAANSARKMAIIANNTAAAFYLNFGAAAVINQGIQLDPNEKFEIGLNNLWTGSITAIKHAGAADIEVFEGT